MPGFCLLTVGCISFTNVMYAVRGLLGGPRVAVLKLFIAGATHEHLTTDALENRLKDLTSRLAPTDIKLNGAIVHALRSHQ